MAFIFSAIFIAILAIIALPVIFAVVIFFYGIIHLVEKQTDKRLKPPKPIDPITAKHIAKIEAERGYNSYAYNNNRPIYIIQKTCESCVYYDCCRDDARLCIEKKKRGTPMTIFYLNCATRLYSKKEETDACKWLADYVSKNDIDIVCLAESSNYNFCNSLPDMYPVEYCWYPQDTPVAKRGYKMNICSKQKVTYTSVDYSIGHEMFDREYADMLVDYGKGTIVSIKAGGYDIVPVHIQYPGNKYRLSPYNIYYELGLRSLAKYMEEKKPTVVFGDFNNYDGDTSFEELRSIYREINTDEDAYSYVSSQGGNKFLIDHAFTLSDNVKMEYINALDNGFDHNGMLITVG